MFENTFMVIYEESFFSIIQLKRNKITELAFWNVEHPLSQKWDLSELETLHNFDEKFQICCSFIETISKKKIFKPTEKRVSVLLDLNKIYEKVVNLKEKVN